MRACAARRGNSAGAFFGTRRPRIRTRSLSRSFVTRSVTIRGVSRFASRRNRSVPLFFSRNPVGCVALVRDVRRFSFEPLFLAAFESAPGHAFLAGDSTFFSWSLAQDHFRCWTCPGAFPGRVRRRRGRTARTCGLTLFFRKRLPVECSRAVFWRCFLRHRATSQARQYDAESSRQAFIFIWTNLHD